MRILGLDPGLRRTGWGVIEAVGDRLRHCANGTVTADDRLALAERLLALHDGLAAVIADWQPAEAAVEESFVNKNPASTLKLGIARGVVLLVPARAGLAVAEYGANHIKKSVVGVGHADKIQVTAMVRRLLPQAGLSNADTDAADALAVAICHAHHRRTAAAIARGAAGAAASSSVPR